MAKKNKKPESIANAPESKPVDLVKHKGLNRKERRKLSKRLHSHNTPYRKGESGGQEAESAGDQS